MSVHSDSNEDNEDDDQGWSHALPPATTEKVGTRVVETEYPHSISVDALLGAGELVKPKKREKVLLRLERFRIEKKEWVCLDESLDLTVETDSFGSGGFRDAYLSVSKAGKKWVIKKYNTKAISTITNSLKSNVEDHTRKQVQMHCFARHIAKIFSNKVPNEFGKSFEFNHAYYALYNEEPARVEEFVEGTFRKYINNTGIVCEHPDESNDALKDISQKAECLVHFSYEQSSNKLMLLDLQGSQYQLYDPEIATAQLKNDVTHEAYFCCGNLSYLGINQFIEKHECNKFCQMLNLDLLV